MKETASSLLRKVFVSYVKHDKQQELLKLRKEHVIFQLTKCTTSVNIIQISQIDEKIRPLMTKIVLKCSQCHGDMEFFSR